MSSARGDLFRQDKEDVIIYSEDTAWSGIQPWVPSWTYWRSLQKTSSQVKKASQVNTVSQENSKKAQA